MIADGAKCVASEKHDIIQRESCKEEHITLFWV